MRSLTLVVFTLFVSLSAFGQAFTLSDEIPLSVPRVRPAPGAQTKPAIAAGDTNFFAVWEHAADDVVGSRIDAQSASPIDVEGGIPIFPWYNADLQPALVWTGNAYSVVFTSGYQIRGVQLTNDGEIVNAVEVSGPRQVGSVSLAWNGSVHLLVWKQIEGVVRARILDRALQPIGDEITVTERGENIAVASDGAGFAVTWTNIEGTFLATLTSAGAAGASLPLSSDPTSVTAIASDGSSYAILRAGFESAEIIHVDRNGTVARRTSMPTGIQTDIHWDGLHYLAVWSAGDRIYGAELDATLNVTRPPVRLVTSETVQLSPAIASNGTRTVLVWADSLPETRFLSDIRGLGVETGAFAAAPSPGGSVISLSRAVQFPLDGLWRGDRLITLWTEGDGAALTLRLGITTQAAGTLTGEGVELPPVANARFAWNGSVYLVVFSHAGSVYGLRLDEQGRSLGGVRIAAGKDPEVASDGDDFLVGFASGEQLYSAIVGGDGVPSEPRFLQRGASIRPIRRILWTGREYVVLSIERTGQSFFSTTETVHSTRVSAAGEPGITTVIVSASGLGGYFSGADMSWNGSEVLYAWSTFRGVRAKIGENGPETIVHGTAFLGEVVWDGSHFVFLMRGPGAVSWSLKRGEQLTELSEDVLPARLVATKGRLAVLYQRRLVRLPTIHNLDLRRAFVRFLEPIHKRRAVR